MNEIHQAIQQIHQGDLGGLEFLARKYYTAAVRTAFLIVRDRAIAEDVIQSFFLAFPKKARSYDLQRPFEPWFFRSIVNAAIDAIAARPQEVSIDHLDEEQGWIEAWTHSIGLPTAIGPEEHLEMEEIRQMIWAALGQLSPRQRAAVIMRYYLEMNEQEMSRELGITRSNIKWILYTARGKLKELLSLHSQSRGSCQPADYDDGTGIVRSRKRL
jgi:RNA polymerase sigma-70 factor (ECF subfamily)